MPQVFADHHPDEVRVHLADSTRVTLQAPLVENDSLVGYTPGVIREGALAVPQRRAIALESVARVEVRGHDATRTSVLVGSVFVLACVTAGAVVFIKQLEDACWGWGGSCR